LQIKGNDLARGMSMAMVTGDPEDGLVALAELVADSVPLEQTMLRVAEYALDMAPNATGAALTEVEGPARVTVATSPRICMAEQAQYEVGQGPGLTAVQEGRPVRSGSIAVESAWPRYSGRVRRLGLDSVLAIPLTLRGSVIAVLTMYAERKAAFTESDAAIAERYAAPAAAIIRNARVLAQCHTEIQQLREALQIRPLIDEAIGIIRSRTGETAEEAFCSLRGQSNRERIKVSELAARIIDDAVREVTNQIEAG
jgi:GAF domain-containing protein